ncbi:DNA-processing protein DprA [Methylobacillus methanolivorans]
MTYEFSPTEKLLVASKIPGIGRKTLIKLNEDPLFPRIPLDELHGYQGEFLAFKPGSSVYERAISFALRDIEIANDQSHSIISIYDKEYPNLLWNIPDRPALLFIKGNLNNFSDKAIAIIGTRDPSNHGIEICDRVTQFFAENNWQIVSGLALGLDTIAHTSALKYQTSTVAVLAHGLDTISPKSNRFLAEEIVDNGGLLVSEYPYQTPTFSSNFVERDRIQAAISRGVFMIQSGLSGGSLHASRAIISYDRYLMIPYPTKLDMMNKISSIEANLLLSNGSDNEKSKLLNCNINSLKNLITVRSKLDYSMLEEMLLSIPRNEIKIKSNKSTPP